MDNLWRIKSDGCQLYLIFPFAPCRVEGLDLTLTLWGRAMADRHTIVPLPTGEAVVQSQEKIQ